MNTIAHAFGTKVGYSDHTDGINVPVAAVAMGASVAKNILPLTVICKDLITKLALSLISSRPWSMLLEPSSRLLVMV